MSVRPITRGPGNWEVEPVGMISTMTRVSGLCRACMDGRKLETEK